MVRLNQYLFFLFFHLPLRFFLRGKIEGTEICHKLKSGPYLLVVNHSAKIDPFLLAMLPFNVLIHFIPYYLPTTERYYSKWWIRIFIKPLGAFQLKAKAWTLEEYFGTTCEFLKQDKNLLLFPEGALASKPFEKPAKPGFVYLVAETNVQIVPIHIHGVAELTFKEFLLRKRSVVLSLGEPFVLGKTHISQYRVVATDILNKIYTL